MSHLQNVSAETPQPVNYELHYHHMAWTGSHQRARECFERMLPKLVATIPGKWAAFVLDYLVPLTADTKQEVIAFCETRYDLSQTLFVKVPRHVNGNGDDCPGNR